MDEAIVARLQEIIRGSRATGRWIDDLDGSVPGGPELLSPETPPPGYYDNQDDPPEQDKADDDAPLMPDDVAPDDAMYLRLVDGVWLRPASWYPYTLEEQRAWNETVIRLAEEAIALMTQPAKG